LFFANIQAYPIYFTKQSLDTPSGQASGAIQNKPAMNTKTKKISPFVLGAALCCYQVFQQPVVRAASLGSENNGLTNLTPSVPVSASGAAGGCPLQSIKNQKGGSPNTQGNSTPTSGSSTALSYQSDLSPNPSAGTSPTVVSQLVPDENCCELGGTSDCEVGGIPPAGGAVAGAGFPLAALAGLGALPLAAIPFIAGGDDNNGSDSTPQTLPPAPVPESSSTASLVAGLGLFGLWYSRRFRPGQRSS
jgi:hypothetical protein